MDIRLSDTDGTKLLLAELPSIAELCQLHTFVFVKGKLPLGVFTCLLALFGALYPRRDFK